MVENQAKNGTKRQIRFGEPSIMKKLELFSLRQSVHTH